MTPTTWMIERPQQWQDDAELMEDWMSDAVCAQTSPDTFFPEKGHRSSARAAKELCSTCPAVQACLAYSIRNDIHEGIWGKHNARRAEEIEEGCSMIRSDPLEIDREFPSEERTYQWKR